MHPNGLTPGLTAAAAGITANVLLGMSSLYWRSLGAVSPATLLVWRIVLSLITLLVIMLSLQRLGRTLSRLTWRLAGVHAAAAILVVTNWGTFIWASIHGHVVESGLGYLIAPFVAIAVGAVVLGEHMGRIRALATIFLAAVVVFLLRSGGELAHWVYLTIGLTWGGYACLKKWSTLDPMGGLLLETALLAPLMLALLLPSLADTTTLWPSHLSYGQWSLLLACGLVSVVPLTLFSLAALGLPLSVMGLFQFVLPTTQLPVALGIYRQPVSATTLGCFGLIWLALVAIIAEPLLSHWSRRKALAGGDAA